MPRRNMGACLLNLGKHQEALEEYNTALELDSSNLNALHNRGVAQKQLGQSEEALESFKAVLEADPTFKQSYRGVIEASMSQEDYDTALEWVDKALEQDESDFTLVTDKANILLKLGQAEESLAWYESVIANGEATEQVNQLYSIALSQTAVAKDQAGDLEAAEGFYDKAIEIEATETRLFNRSYLYMRTERLPEAIEGFTAVVELKPSNIKAQAVLGTLLLQEGRFEDCLGPLQAASEGSEGEDFTDVTYNLGFAMLKVERYEEAAGAFESVLSVDPDNVNAQNGLRAAQHAVKKAARVAEKTAAAEAAAAAAEAAAAAAAESPEGGEERAAEAAEAAEVAAAELAAVEEEDEEDDEVPELPVPSAMNLSASDLAGRGFVRRQVKRLSVVPGARNWGKGSRGAIGARAPAPAAAAAATAAPAKKTAPVAASGAPEEITVEQFYDISALAVPAASLPEGVEPAHREQWLDDEDFEATFGMDKATFNAQPKWKRINQKKKANLF